jgi:hypothetical protein
MPLPKPVIVDLFDVEYRPSQVAIDHVADLIEGFGFRVSDINDYDIRVWFNFGMVNRGLDGKLIVDRMTRTFEIFAEDGGITYTALKTKDFDQIEKFLQLLEEDVNDPMGQATDNIAGGSQESPSG